MHWKLKLNTTWHRPGVFIADFDPGQYINIVFRLLTWNKYLSEGCERTTYLFCNKRPISFSDLQKNLSAH